MTAAEALKTARAAGIRLAIDGDDLVLEAPARPPRAVLNLLSRHKLDLLSLLRNCVTERIVRIDCSETHGLVTTLSCLEHRCPDYVEVEQWQQCLSDARHFLAKWGKQASSLGWTPRDLFGLRKPLEDLHPSYHRLSRYDATGLLWLLRGHPVVALTETTAAIQTSSGPPIIYRKNNKPALGPVVIR